MNEIKEILDKLKDSVDNPTIDVPTYDGSDSEPMDNIAIIKPNACKQLLDYITNLQQENERLKEDNLLIKSANKLVSDNLHIYKSRMDKATQLYLKELSKKGKVDDLACKMFNLLEENIK